MEPVSLESKNVLELNFPFPKVSVIIPSYNHARFVKQAILSVVMQTYENVELIVVDDGSNDESRIIIKELRDQYNFKYFEQPNSGSASALNVGIRNSTGKYVCFLASDDYYHYEKIADQVMFYEENQEYGLIHSGAIVVDEIGRELNRTDFVKTNWNVSKSFELLLEGCFISAPSVMIKRSVLDAVGVFDEQLKIDDWDLWLRISKKFAVGFQKKWFVYWGLLWCES